MRYKPYMIAHYRQINAKQKPSLSKGFTLQYCELCRLTKLMDFLEGLLDFQSITGIE